MIDPKYTAPTTRKQAFEMIRPLRPMANDATLEEKVIAFNRLSEFIELFLPE